MDLNKIFEIYGIDNNSWHRYKKLGCYIVNHRSRIVDIACRRISREEKESCLEKSGTINLEKYDELVRKKLDEYAEEILNTETGKELQNYLKSIEKTAITYNRLKDILDEYYTKYEIEVGGYETCVKEFIEYKIIPKYNILVYDPLSLTRGFYRYNYNESSIRSKSMYDSNIEQLSEPPKVNIEELVERNDLQYKNEQYKQYIKEKQDCGLLPKNLNDLNKPTKNTSPDLGGGIIFYVILMIFSSIFYARVYAWVMLTIWFIIWVIYENGKYN